MSPFDVLNRGRAIPLTWVYGDVLDANKLVSSLEETLSLFPSLAGRYGKRPCIRCSNVGVPVDFGTLPTLQCPSDEGESFAVFERNDHEATCPKKAGMDPDPCDETTPLLAIKVTTALDGSGTAIGLLVQHGVCDMNGAMAFARAWSKVCLLRGSNSGSKWSLPST